MYFYCFLSFPALVPEPAPYTILNFFLFVSGVVHWIDWFGDIAQSSTPHQKQNGMSVVEKTGITINVLICLTFFNKYNIKNAQS